MESEMALMIPIIAIVMGIGVAAWSIYWDHQKKRLQYEERLLMIEKGMTPPEIAVERKLVTPEDCLRRGTIMFFLGIGLGIASLTLRDAVFDGPPAWLLGVPAAIVGLLGLGNLVYYFIARNREPYGAAADKEK